MILKIIGAAFVIAGCGGIGFRIAANHCAEEKNIRHLINILDYMECELQYRLTPFPELCKQAEKMFDGPVAKVFGVLSDEIQAQVSPDIEVCMSSAANKVLKLTPLVFEELLLFGKSAGRFDLDGQIKGLEAVRQDCRRQLEGLSFNRDVRLRSYQTLGLCAGAALAILFV